LVTSKGQTASNPLAGWRDRWETGAGGGGDWGGGPGEQSLRKERKGVKPATKSRGG